MIKKLAEGTLLSILVFLSISFISVLVQINSPLQRDVLIGREIGFPLTYYYEFMVDCSIPNSGWNLKNLILDSVLTWLVVIGSYLFFKREK